MKRRASFIDMVPGVGVSPSKKSDPRRLIVDATSASSAPPDTASPRLSAQSVEFLLGETTLQEVQLVQDHFDNYIMIQELTTVLQSRGPHGPIGTLSIDGVDVEEMSLVIHKSERTKPKTKEAQVLLDSAHVILDVRSALIGGDWGGVEALLDGVATRDNAIPAPDPGPGAPLPRAGFARSVHAKARGELLRVREEVDCRIVVAELSKSLESGGATGDVGNLNITTVTVERLVVAMDLGTKLGCPTQKSKHLYALAKLVWQVRQALLSRDWDSVESLLESSSEVLGLSGTLPPGCDVPKACTLEFGVLAAEINNRRVQQKLRAALQTGVPLGEVGHLNLTMIDWTGLESALQYAMKVGVITRTARQLTATASLIRALRRSLSEGKWELLGALIDHTTGGGEFGMVRAS